MWCLLKCVVVEVSIKISRVSCRIRYVNVLKVNFVLFLEMISIFGLKVKRNGIVKIMILICVVVIVVLIVLLFEIDVVVKVVIVIGGVIVEVILK